MRSVFILLFVPIAACSTGALPISGAEPSQPEFPMRAQSGPRVGRVMIASGLSPVAGKLVPLALAEASFADVEHPPSCSRRSAGGCVVEDCTPTGTPSLRYLGAGRIRIEARRPLTLDPDSNGYYAPRQDLGSALWSPGEWVTVQAAGDIAPAFSAALRAPSAIEVIAPSLTAGGVDIDRRRALRLVWDGGPIGTVAFQLRSDADDGGHTLLCQFPARAGGGSIPASALALLPAGPAHLAIVPFESDAPVDGDAEIQVFTVGSALQRGQDISNSNATLN